MISRGRSDIYDNREYIIEYGYAVMDSIKSFSEEMRNKIEEKKMNAHDYALTNDNDPQVQRDIENACYPEEVQEKWQLEIINRTMACMLFTYYDNSLLFLAEQYGMKIPERKGPRYIFNPLIEAGLFPILHEDRIFISHLLRYMRNVIIHGERDKKEEKQAMNCIKELSLSITINGTFIKGIDIPFLQNALERLIRALLAIDNTLIILNMQDGGDLNDDW